MTGVGSHSMYVRMLIIVNFFGGAGLVVFYIAQHPYHIIEFPPMMVAFSIL